MSLATRPAMVPYTYEEYRFLPEDGKRYELVDGDLYVTPAPNPFHQTVSRRLQYALMTALEEKGVALVFNAPCDIILEETSVVQPDLAVIRASRRDIISERGIEGAPDLVVEILSPSSRGQDLHLKRAAYARFAIPEYWIVDPSHGFVEVLLLGEKAYTVWNRFDRASTLHSPGFSEIAIPLAPVFRPH